jgi:uncharacterized phiE125 gp8 family phage protein
MLASNALTTLSAVKEYLKIDPLNTNEDTLLEALINASSSAIENYCKRSLVEQTFIEEYDGNGMKYLQLNQYPVNSITSVTVDGVVLDPSEYKVKKKTGTLIRVDSIWPEGDLNIAVEFTAGYNPIPYDLELACKHLVYFYYKTDIANFSSTFQEGFVIRPESLPVQVKALLAPYRRVLV